MKYRSSQQYRAISHKATVGTTSRCNEDKAEACD